VSRDHGLGGLAVSAGYLAALSSGPLRDHGGKDPPLNHRDAVCGESGVYLLLDSPPGLRRAALERRRTLWCRRRRRVLRLAG